MTDRSSRRWALAGTLALLTLGATAAATHALPASAPALQGARCTWQGIGNATKAVYYAAAAMDTDANHLYLFGGLDASLDTQNTLQRVDLSAGTVSAAPHTVVTGIAAQKRFGAAAAYRPQGASSAVYFIGGSDDVQTGNGTSDVQVYRTSARQWQPLAATGTFESRFFHAAAYDPLHDAIWVTGGLPRCGLADIAADRCVARTYATKYLTFDAGGSATWHELGGGGPTSIYGHTMTFDSLGKRLLVVGGTRDGRQGSSDVWQLDLSPADPAQAAWSSVATAGANLPRLALHGAAYDAARNWLVLYGGVTSDFNTPDENIGTATFALDLAQTPPAWVNLGASLQERVGASVAYAPLQKAIVLMGGRRASKAAPPQDVQRDTNALVCADQGTPAPTPGGATATSILPPPATAVPTATSVLPPPATAVPTSPAGTGQVCRFIQRFNRVPAAVINAALANPGAVYGYNRPCNPSVPSSGFNRPRTYLSIHDTARPYHPLYNALEYKCGCP